MAIGNAIVGAAAVFPPTKLEDGLVVGLVAGLLLSGIPCGLAAFLAKKTGSFGVALKLCVPTCVLGFLFGVAGLVCWAAGTPLPIAAMLGVFGAAMLLTGLGHIETIRGRLGKLKGPVRWDQDRTHPASSDLTPAAGGKTHSLHFRKRRGWRRGRAE